jgi:hypothetical protein
MQRRRPHRIGDIGDIGAAFWDRAVAITTITIGWLTAIGHISIKRRLTQGPCLRKLSRAPGRHPGQSPRTPQLCKQIRSDRIKGVPGTVIDLAPNPVVPPETEKCAFSD